MRFFRVVMRRMGGAPAVAFVVAFVGAALLNVACLRAQVTPTALVHLRGQMVDSAGHAIPGVQLLVVASGRRTVSDSIGFFAMDSLQAGLVSLSFTHPRFAPITLDLPLVAGDTTRMPVMLSAVEETVTDDLAPASVFGRVTDVNGFPLTGAEVLVASTGQTVATDTLGRFFFTGLRPTQHLLRVRRIGFYVQYLNVTMTESGAVRARVALEPMGTSLAEVVVRADRVVPRLKRFYERKAGNGFGQFATREDFAARGWISLIDVLGNMRGVRMGSDDMGRATPMTRSTCPMRVLLDGLPLDLDGVALTSLVNIRDLAGVEVYRRGDEAPLEFAFGTGRSGGCGVLALWTR